CKASKVAHFVLSKPFNEQDIVDLFVCIEKIKTLPFSDNVRAMLNASCAMLPQPDLAKQVRAMINKHSCKVADVVSIVSHEPLAAARLLQIANSAFLGFGKSTMSLDEAVKRL